MTDGFWFWRTGDTGQDNAETQLGKIKVNQMNPCNVRRNKGKTVEWTLNE